MKRYKALPKTHTQGSTRTKEKGSVYKEQGWARLTQLPMSPPPVPVFLPPALRTEPRDLSVLGKRFITDPYS